MLAQILHRSYFNHLPAHPARPPFRDPPCTRLRSGPLMLIVKRWPTAHLAGLLRLPNRGIRLSSVP